MPFQGTELQAFLCNKWGKENGFFYDQNGDAFIKAIDGWAVRALSDDDGDVLVTDYGANGLKIEKRKSSMSKPFGKQKRCKTTEEAVAEFTDTPANKNPHNCKADNTAVHQKNITETTPCNSTPRDEANTSTGNVAEHDIPDNCTDVNIISDADYVGGRELVMGKDGKLYRMRIGGDDAGVIDGLCRDYESERASFKKLADECIKSCYFKKSCAFTLTTYVPQSFADIKSAVSKMVKKYLFSKFENLKCVFAFCEPHADGSWHCHLILCFRDVFPNGLYETVLKSWKNRIVVPSGTYKIDENLVDLRYFSKADEFIKYVDYLNPVSKKKRSRLKFYPNRKKSRGKYGETEKTKKVIMPASEAKKLTECEHTALRHEIKIVNASSTIFSGKEDLKFHQFTYYYTKNDGFWSSIIEAGKIEKNDFCESETVPPTTDLQPHFSVTIFTRGGDQFGKTMTEVDFDFDMEKAIKLADFYERNSKLFGGVEVIRVGIPIQQGVSMA